MERLVYTEQKKYPEAKKNLRQMAISLAVSASMIWTLCSTFKVEGGFIKLSFANLLGQFANFWNQISEFLLINDGLIIKELAGQTETCSGFLLVATLVGTAVCQMIIKSKKIWLLILPAAVTILPVTVTSSEPSVLAAAVLTAVVMLMAIELKQKEGISLRHILCIAVFFTVITSVFSNGTASWMTNKADAIKKLEKAIEEKAEDIYYGTNLLENGIVSKENRTGTYDSQSRFGSLEGEKTALTVSMTEPQSTYLKGFTGEMYQDGSWAELPYGVYKEKKHLFYWLHKGGFNGIGQLGQAGASVYEKEENKIRVQVKDADSRYAYLPYEVSGIDKETLSKYDVNLTAGNFGKIQEYTAKTTGEYVSRWTDVAGRYHTEPNVAKNKDETGKSISNLKVNESYYNQFVYEYYTYISEEDQKILKEFIGHRPSFKTQHMEYSQAIEKVRTYLEENAFYTEVPGLEKSDGGVLESFLRTGKGYDTHFATAATLMFRYYGIAARYAEGYMVTPEDVESAEEGQAIDIAKNRVHAWTEIYIDGIGFVPLEVSPKYKGLMREADLSKGIEYNSAYMEQKNYKSMSKNLQRLESGQTQKEKKSVLMNVLKLLTILLIAVAAAIGLAKIMAKAYRKWNTSRKYRKLFRSKDMNLAVAAIYQYMEGRGMEISSQAKRIGNKGCYSRHSITEEERNQMVVCLKEASKKEKKQKREKGKRNRW